MPRMHAMATAVRKAADNATRTTPSILSTGRRSAFRPVSSRTGRDTQRALTLVITGGRPSLGEPRLMKRMARGDSWKAHHGRLVDVPPGSGAAEAGRDPRRESRH